MLIYGIDNKKSFAKSLVRKQVYLFIPKGPGR